MCELQSFTFPLTSRDVTACAQDRVLQHQQTSAGEVITLDDLLEPPGRYIRPPKIVVIFRGLPGSGKTFIAKNIKNKETELGSDAPRILDLDAYFESDGQVSFVELS
jgi:Mrp family chromosome partitioning ATPase